MVIEKAGEYGILIEESDNIYLNPEQLYSILPNEWKFLNEFTILANKLSEEKWLKMVSDSKTISQKFIF